MKIMKRIETDISPMKLILGGYCMIILIGAILLTLPVASRAGSSTPFSDCFFTATSATCVTGLIRFDTYTHWSLFGQLVVLGLIQIGGIGFMTIAILILVAAKRKIGLAKRSLMQDSISAPQLGGIVKMTKFIALGTMLVELVGAVLLSFSFVPRFGLAKGIYFSVFHSISAFCNAGFDLMGGSTGEFSSLTGVADDWYVNIVIMSLIVIGGLGFFMWHDLKTKGLKFRKLTLQSKMVLSLSIGLVLGGALIFFLLENASGTYISMNFGEKLLVSLFQSVTARTAGFNTIDLAAMSEAGVFVMIALMYVGGSTGSTAGGIKTTTFWVLCVSVFATFRRKKNIEAFGRRMEENITRTASCVFVFYLLLTTSTAVAISVLEGIPMLTALFETVSAMATVGVTLGITPEVGMISKWILIVLMICGRVGSITMLLAFSSEKKVICSKLPLEKIQIG